MAIQKFLNLEGLSIFLDNLRSTFSPSKHTHTKSEITDLTVDSALSSTSTNPVQNSTVTAALDQKVPVTRTVNGKALSSDVSLSPADVGADPTGTATTAVSQHNVATEAHNDIRLLISELSTKLNNFLNVDDTTKDQLSEVIAMIEANEGTIESLTSGKVNVTDIIDNLTTNVSNKPLAAAQGVAIKALIDDLKVAYKAADTTLSNSLATHTGNTSNPHNVTKEQVGLSDVENKSSATIRSELTSENVINALGYTPPEQDTVYTHPSYSAKTSGLYKVTVDATGHVSAVSAVTKDDLVALGLPAQDTTYTLSSFGITATADELNYVDGVTSNVQIQLDDKASTAYVDNAITTKIADVLSKEY